MFLFPYVLNFYIANPQHLVLTNPWEMVTNLWVYSIQRPWLLSCVSRLLKIRDNNIKSYLLFSKSQISWHSNSAYFCMGTYNWMWFIVFYIHGVLNLCASPLSWFYGMPTGFAHLFWPPNVFIYQKFEDKLRLTFKKKRL